VREAFGGPIAFLVNNAGAHYDNGARCAALTVADFEDAFAVNTLGTVRMTAAVLPEMKKIGFGRIVNVTSRSGSFAGTWKNAPAYGVSKCAVNMYTMQLAADLKKDGDGVLVNACCPGWVRTRMGGENATKSPAEGAQTPVFLCMLADDAKSPSGCFFGEEKEVDW
jgi:NAD(P)-dependent dehydrogenase (short-subunit alcohol dehydrogenase family)